MVFGKLFRYNYILHLQKICRSETATAHKTDKVLKSVIKQLNNPGKNRKKKRNKK